MNKIRVVCIGIGGFGNQYIREILEDPRAEKIELVAVCDPFPAGCRYLDRLQEMQVPVYSSPEEMFEHVQADLAVISTPIFLHSQHASLAYANGCDVLLEKPIAAVQDDAQIILDARDKAGKHLAIGYQWCYDAAMRTFKQDILNGRFGRFLSMKAMVLWPRDLGYYTRGLGWAGKRTSKDGRPVFDSVASNATAHYIMNMLFLAGDTPSGAALLHADKVLTARANDIEMFDTIAFRGTIGNVPVTYCASHAVQASELVNPVFSYVFEKGRADFSEDEGGILEVRMNDGSTVSYGRSVPNGANIEKLWCVVDAMQNDTWDALPCTGETALSHTHAMAQLNAVPVQDCKDRRVMDAERNQWYIPGIAAQLHAVYDTGVLPEKF